MPEDVRARAFRWLPTALPVRKFDSRLLACCSHRWSDGIRYLANVIGEQGTVMWLRLTDDGKPLVVNFDNVLWFRSELDGARTLIQATNHEKGDIEHLTFFVDQRFESICTRLGIKSFEEG